MLTSLHIENIAVAKNVDIDFDGGFTVVTGETGAGKSIIVDCISLLLGGKFRLDMLRTGENSAMVSGYFSDVSEDNLHEIVELGIEPDDDGGFFVQRDFSADGKVRNRLNGRAIPISLLKTMTGLLINIHGQHDNQKLLDPRSHCSLLDSYAEDSELLDVYRAVYAKIRDVREKINAATVSDAEKARETEMLKYQIEDISALKIAPDEEDALEQRRELLRNIEKNRKHTDLIYRALYRNKKGTSADALVEMAIESLGALSDVMPNADECISRLDSVRSELEDIAECALSVTDGISGDPVRELNDIESRISVLKKLRKKYGSTVAEIMEFRDNAQRRLDDLENSDFKIKELKREEEKLVAEARSAAEQLYLLRQKAAEELEKLICRQLAFLDMNSAVFRVSIDHDPENLLPNGTDEVEFLLSANAGEAPKSLAMIASGGELARIMLGIKSVFAEKEGTQTLIYDEIDTGISGKTSQKLGLVLKSCADSAQVICVTHSAQIAAAAEHHLLVSKRTEHGRTMSGVCEIHGDDRVNEVARIMGGNTITDKLRESARDLINETK